MDLAASGADATEYFKDQKDREVEKLFWSQFNVPVPPLLLNEQMAERAKLRRLSRLAMRSVVDLLWLKAPRPNSYFGLVQRFLGAVPHIDTVKRKACIKGAWMALARVKTYWAEKDATAIAPPGPAVGQVSTKHYLGEVLEGARLIEAQC